MLARVLAALTATLVPLNASAWFFFLIPGSVIDGVADAVTGAEGENCVSRSAKVGDEIKLPDGSRGVVHSLSGESRRCSNPKWPVRAKLIPVEAGQKPAQAVAAPASKPCPLVPPQVETPLSDPTRPAPPADGCTPLDTPPKPAMVPVSAPAATPQALSTAAVPKPAAQVQPELKAPEQLGAGKSVAPTTQDITERLKQLEKLKSERLVSDAEYEELRAKILKSL